MKTRVISYFGALLVMGSLLSFTGCMKNNAKNSSLKITASSLKSANMHQSGIVPGQIQLTSGMLRLTSANISIAGLQIEENSGNDVQQQVGDQQQGGVEDHGGSEANDNEKKNEGTETGNEDILLPGPFSLDISGGNALIDQVNVYPGTFKKVDFSFQASNIAPFNGHSIVIKGKFVTANSSTTLFILQSDFVKQVQLPLANGGITVKSNSTVSVSIVFDLKAWLGNLDLTGVTLTNGKIIINKMNNASLLAAFEANVAANIDVENE